MCFSRVIIDDIRFNDFGSFDVIAKVLPKMLIFNRNHYDFVFVDHCRLNKMCGICAVFNLNGSNNGGGMSMKVSVLL